MIPNKAIIIAGGRGSRLKPLTDTMPKCLTEVNGKSILVNALDILEKNGIKETIIVVGYLKDKVKEAIKYTFRNMKINYVDNDDYDKTNNSYGLWLGIKDLNESVLILEGDVFFSKELFEKFLKHKEENSTIVEKYNSNLDGSFVGVENSIINSWTHKKDRPIGFTIENKYKTVNIHKYNANFVQNYLIPTLKKHVDETGGTEPIEFIFRDIVKKTKINAFDTNGLKWFEIDDAKDLVIAEDIFKKD